LSYFLAAAAAVLVGLSKTGLPGAAIPAVALMAQAFPDDAELSVGALLPVLLVGDVFAVAYYRRHAQWGKLLGLLPYVALGMAPGYLVLRAVEGNQLRPVLGTLVLLLFVLEACRRRFGWTRMPESRWFIAAMGALAGFGTMVGNAAGPVMTIYLVSRGLAKQQFVGTAAWFFFLVNLTKVLPYASQDMITPATLAVDLRVMPAVVLGVLAGIWLLPRIPQRWFDPLVLGLAGLAGAWLLVT
jgi:hypothetical protein